MTGLRRGAAFLPSDEPSMTRVDFYVLENADSDSLMFACRLVEKAFLAGHRVHVTTTSAEEAGRLDNLLWTFRPGSFVPHCLDSRRPTDEPLATPVTIGSASESADDARDVLVNLSGKPPREPARYRRVAEIVAADAASKDAARERYRQYRSLGCELHSHTIT